MAREQRRLAAIVAADVVGYPKCTQPGYATSALSDGRHARDCIILLRDSVTRAGGHFEVLDPDAFQYPRHPLVFSPH